MSLPYNNCCPPITPFRYNEVVCKSSYFDLIAAREDAARINKAREEAKACCNGRNGIVYTTLPRKEASLITFNNTARASTVHKTICTGVAPTLDQKIMRDTGAALGCCVGTTSGPYDDPCLCSRGPLNIK